MLSIAFSFLSVCAIAQTKTDTIKVYGNCEICKGKIEKAARAAGAETANWNDETKMLTVSYNEVTASNMNIQKQIASAGYDTQDVKAFDDAYNKLPECCQYERANGNDESSMNMQHDNMSCCANMSMEKCTKDGCCKADISCCTNHEAGKDCCANGKCSGSK